MPMIDGSDSSSIKNVQYIPSVTLHLSDHIFLQVIVANNYTFGSLMFDITSGLPDWVGFLLDWVGFLLDWADFFIGLGRFFYWTG